VITQQTRFRSTSGFNSDSLTIRAASRCLDPWSFDLDLLTIPTVVLDKPAAAPSDIFTLNPRKAILYLDRETLQVMIYAFVY
jgi:hypothetical protein